MGAIEDYENRYRLELVGLVEGFEFEVCDICGEDVSRHTFGPDPLGKPHSWCMAASPEDEDLPEDDEETEDEPEEDDGFITDSRDGYAVSFSGKYTGTWPRYEMAVYELARVMTREGFYPNLWHVNERGNMDLIHEQVTKYEGEDGKLLIPAGRQYVDDATVIVSEPLSDWPTWVVICDYGTEGGIYMHTSGDPSVTLIAEGDDRDSIREATDADFE